MNYQKRISRARDFIEKKHLPAVLINNPSNIFYLTGLLEIEGMLVIDGKTLTFFVPSLYYNETTSLSRLGIETVIYQKDIFKKFLKRYRKLGFTETAMSFGGYRSLSKENNLVPLPDFVKEMRMVKDDAEIRNIRKALIINKRLFKDIKPYIENEEKETVIAGHIHYLIRKYGGRKDAFEPIIASGIASSCPHHKNRNRKITKGKPVVVDAGVDYCGYKSDLTRTFLPGCPEQRFKDIYKILQEIQGKVIEFIKTGMTGSEIHSYAVGLLKTRGLDKYFIHGLGHGIGIDVHEFPVLAPDSKDVLTQGCVFTVEPGIYLPGAGGIRLEEMVFLT